MGLRTSNNAVLGAVQAQNNNNFKSMNNLLSLQDNHVEEFFQYHGEMFLVALERLMEDVTERVVNRALSKLAFETQGSNIALNNESKMSFDKITQEKIDLDIQTLLASAINAEVVNQRKLAKSQYLESQGFGNPQGMHGVQQAQGQYGQMQQAYGHGMNAMQNGSGYPVAPAGTDGYGRPYWIDPANGQMSYEPPSSGLHMGEVLQKGAAWAKWLM